MPPGADSESRRDCVLEVARRAAEDALLDRTIFNVDEADFAAFVALLDAPPQPNERLRRTMRTPASWDHPAPLNNDTGTYDTGTGRCAGHPPSADRPAGALASDAATIIRRAVRAAAPACRFRRPAALPDQTVQEIGRAHV